MLFSEETFPAFLFACLVATIVFLALSSLVRIVLERFELARPTKNRAVIQGRRIVLGIALSGVPCIVYGYFVEPYWPEVTHSRVESAKLAPGSGPVRIAHISDLHCDPEKRLEDRIPELIAAEHPDAIVFTGDAINSPEGLGNFRECMTRLAAVAPTFAVKGNWDSWYHSDLDLFGGTGVTELDGNAASLDVRGATVWIGGIAVRDEERIDSATSAMPADKLSVFLYHYGDRIYDASRRGVDIYCAGHTHGGQVAIPFYGALITLSKYGKRFEAGLYRVENTWLYVNRGVGMEGGTAPRVRFCARPEITIIDVVPAGG